MSATASTKLKHELADVLGLQGSMAELDRFVEIALVTEFQNEVNVSIGLERINQN